MLIHKMYIILKIKSYIVHNETLQMAPQNNKNRNLLIRLRLKCHTQTSWWICCPLPFWQNTCCKTFTVHKESVITEVLCQYIVTIDNYSSINWVTWYDTACLWKFFKKRKYCENVKINLTQLGSYPMKMYAWVP